MKKLRYVIVVLAFFGLNEAIGQWNTSGSNIYNTNTGNVGIGNSSPTTLLYVAKSMTEPTITVHNLGGIGGATYSMVDNFSGANWKFKATNAGGFKIRDHANGLDVFVIEQNSASNLLYLKNGGNIGIGTPTPDNSALIDMSSVNRGFLPPRMTTEQRDAISTPAEGLLLFNLTTGCFDYYFGGSWKSFCGATEPSFQCGMTINDSRDGQVYNTVLIGTQCWMAENLNTGSRINGSLGQSNNSDIEKYCYDDSESNCAIYGGLYQWNEMMQYTTQEGTQGICPDGWHVPGDAEWTALTNYVSSQSGFLCNSNTTYIGKALAAQTNWQTSADICAVGNNLTENNATGFTGLPGGLSYSDGGFDDVGIFGRWWTSAENGSPGAWYRFLLYYYPEVYRVYDPKSVGFSVRCLRDN